MTTLMTFSWFSPYLGGGSVGNLMLALLPLHICAGRGWGCGWLGPPLFFVSANGWVGAGSRGQPLHMTIYTYLTSYIQSSQEFLSLTLVLIHTYSQIVGSFSDSRSSSSSSLLLYLSHVHFLQPTTFISSYVLWNSPTKSNPTLFPSREGGG